MSSGFVTESEIAEARQKRQEEWEKVRQPDQPLGKRTLTICFVFKVFWNTISRMVFPIEIPERPEESYDSRSLFDRLKEQRDKKDLEFEEAHKLSK